MALLVFVTLVAYLGRDGYRDLNGTPVGFLDALYYSTVSITTTGYGDITPVTDEARLVTTVLITPARILFLIILVGTTIEVLAERTRTAVRERIWRSGLKDHTIVIGFGTKGRAAVETLIARGVDRSKIVVIDQHPEAIEEATRTGLAGIHGSAGRTAVLEAAGIKDAASVIVATDRDDAAVLVTLTARELDPDATIVAAAREAENVAPAQAVRRGLRDPLLGRRRAAARPGRAQPADRRGARGPAVGRPGIDLVEREVGPAEAGMELARSPRRSRSSPSCAASTCCASTTTRVATLEAGDRLICLSPAKKDRGSELEPHVQVVVVVHERHDDLARALRRRLGPT